MEAGKKPELNTKDNNSKDNNNMNTCIILPSSSQYQTKDSLDKTKSKDKSRTALSKVNISNNLINKSKFTKRAMTKKKESVKYIKHLNSSNNNRKSNKNISSKNIVKNSNINKYDSSNYQYDILVDKIIKLYDEKNDNSKLIKKDSKENNTNSIDINNKGNNSINNDIYCNIATKMSYISETKEYNSEDKDKDNDYDNIFNSLNHNKKSRLVHINSNLLYNDSNNTNNTNNTNDSINAIKSNSSLFLFKNNNTEISNATNISINLQTSDINLETALFMYYKTTTFFKRLIKYNIIRNSFLSLPIKLIEQSTSNDINNTNINNVNNNVSSTFITNFNTYNKNNTNTNNNTTNTSLFPLLQNIYITRSEEYNNRLDSEKLTNNIYFILQGKAIIKKFVLTKTEITYQQLLNYLVFLKHTSQWLLLEKFILSNKSLFPTINSPTIILNKAYNKIFINKFSFINNSNSNYNSCNSTNTSNFFSYKSVLKEREKEKIECLKELFEICINDIKSVVNNENLGDGLSFNASISKLDIFGSKGRKSLLRGKTKGRSGLKQMMKSGNSDNFHDEENSNSNTNNISISSNNNTGFKFNMKTINNDSKDGKYSKDINNIDGTDIRLNSFNNKISFIDGDCNNKEVAKNNENEDKKDEEDMKEKIIDKKDNIMISTNSTIISDNNNNKRALRLNLSSTEFNKNNTNNNITETNNNKLFPLSIRTTRTNRYSKSTIDANKIKNLNFNFNDNSKNKANMIYSNNYTSKSHKNVITAKKKSLKNRSILISNSHTNDNNDEAGGNNYSVRRHSTQLIKRNSSVFKALNNIFNINTKINCSNNNSKVNVNMLNTINTLSNIDSCSQRSHNFNNFIFKDKQDNYDNDEDDYDGNVNSINFKNSYIKQRDIVNNRIKLCLSNRINNDRIFKKNNIDNYDNNIENSINTTYRTIRNIDMKQLIKNKFEFYNKNSINNNNNILDKEKKISNTKINKDDHIIIKNINNTSKISTLTPLSLLNKLTKTAIIVNLPRLKKIATIREKDFIGNYQIFNNPKSNYYSNNNSFDDIVVSLSSNSVLLEIPFMVVYNNKSISSEFNKLCISEALFCIKNFVFMKGIDFELFIKRYSALMLYKEKSIGEFLLKCDNSSNIKDINISCNADSIDNNFNNSSSNNCKSYYDFCEEVFGRNDEEEISSTNSCNSKNNHPKSDIKELKLFYKDHLFNSLQNQDNMVNTNSNSIISINNSNNSNTNIINSIINVNTNNQIYYENKTTNKITIQTTNKQDTSDIHDIKTIKNTFDTNTITPSKLKSIKSILLSNAETTNINISNASTRNTNTKSFNFLYFLLQGEVQVTITCSLLKLLLIHSLLLELINSTTKEKHLSNSIFNNFDNKVLLNNKELLHKEFEFPLFSSNSCSMIGYELLFISDYMRNYFLLNEMNLEKIDGNVKEIIRNYYNTNSNTNTSINSNSATKDNNNAINNDFYASENNGSLKSLDYLKLIFSDLFYSNFNYKIISNKAAYYKLNYDDINIEDINTSHFNKYFKDKLLLLLSRLEFCFKTRIEANAFTSQSLVNLINQTKIEQEKKKKKEIERLSDMAGMVDISDINNKEFFSQNDKRKNIFNNLKYKDKCYLKENKTITSSISNIDNYGNDCNGDNLDIMKCTNNSNKTKTDKNIFFYVSEENNNINKNNKNNNNDHIIGKNNRNVNSKSNSESKTPIISTIKKLNYILNTNSSLFKSLKDKSSNNDINCNNNNINNNNKSYNNKLTLVLMSLIKKENQSSLNINSLINYNKNDPSKNEVLINRRKSIMVSRRSSVIINNSNSYLSSASINNSNDNNVNKESNIHKVNKGKTSKRNVSSNSNFSNNRKISMGNLIEEGIKEEYHKEMIKTNYDDNNEFKYRNQEEDYFKNKTYEKNTITKTNNRNKDDDYEKYHKFLLNSNSNNNVNSIISDSGYQIKAAKNSKDININKDNERYRDINNKNNSSINNFISINENNEVNDKNNSNIITSSVGKTKIKKSILTLINNTNANANSNPYINSNRNKKNSSLLTSYDRKPEYKLNNITLLNYLLTNDNKAIKPNKMLKNNNKNNKKDFAFNIISNSIDDYDGIKQGEVDKYNFINSDYYSKDIYNEVYSNSAIEVKDSEVLDSNSNIHSDVDENEDFEVLRGDKARENKKLKIKSINYNTIDINYNEIRDRNENGKIKDNKDNDRSFKQKLNFQSLNFNIINKNNNNNNRYRTLDSHIHTNSHTNTNMNSNVNMLTSINTNTSTRNNQNIKYYLDTINSINKNLITKEKRIDRVRVSTIDKTNSSINKIKSVHLLKLKDLYKKLKINLYDNTDTVKSLVFNKKK